MMDDDRLMSVCVELQAEKGTLSVKPQLLRSLSVELLTAGTTVFCS